MAFALQAADVQQTAILAPFLAMMAMTLVVWAVMYVRRINFIVGQRIDPERLKTPEQGASIIPDTVSYPAYNLRNLTELPVLFYALCLYLYVTNSVDLFYVIAAWVFVAFRSMHSVIHCTSNRVLYRFYLYMFAALALWSILLRALLQFIG